jgi:hypothetical protein
LAYGKGRISHGASLILFLIFRKKLLFDPFPSAAIQKQLALNTEPSRVDPNRALAEERGGDAERCG